MTQEYRGDAIPDDLREREVRSDPSLGTEEKELRMVAPNDVDYCRVGTEIPTFIKWLQSIPTSTFESVRIDEHGAIVACRATIPKGVLKLQATARKSDQHSQMVSYGDLNE